MKVYPFPKPQEERGDFCRTPVAADMLQLIETTVAMRAIGSIVGAPGIGKTMTLMHYARRTAGASYCAANPTVVTMSAVLSMACRALGVASDRGGEAMHRLIRTMMEWNRTSVLIVDEAQHLTDQGLDELRCIHDEARIPLVLAGNHSLRHRVSGSNESAFAQLTSRIGPKLDVARTTAADVNALASHYGINDEEAVSWLRTRCAGVGGLRAASHLLTLCRDVADVGEIRLSHLKTAAAALGAGQ